MTAAAPDPRTQRHPGGRPRLPIDHARILALYQHGQESVTSIARLLGVDRSRVRRVVADAGLLRDDRGSHWSQKRDAL